MVLVEPGFTRAFGKIVDQFTRDLQAAEMQYVPKTRYVIGAADMLDPQEADVLQIEVPEKATFRIVDELYPFEHDSQGPSIESTGSRSQIEIR